MFILPFGVPAVLMAYSRQKVGFCRVCVCVEVHFSALVFYSLSGSTRDLVITCIKCIDVPHAVSVTDLFII